MRAYASQMEGATGVRIVILVLIMYTAPWKGFANRKHIRNPDCGIFGAEI